MITVLGPIKYWACTLLLPACLPNRNVPAAQTVAQAAIFFPPGNYGRVSGIMRLLANARKLRKCPISEAIAYIFDEQRLYNEARALLSLFPVPLWFVTWVRETISKSILRRENIFSPNNFLSRFTLFLVRDHNWQLVAMRNFNVHSNAWQSVNDNWISRKFSLC